VEVGYRNEVEKIIRQINALKEPLSKILKEPVIGKNAEAFTNIIDEVVSLLKCLQDMIKEENNVQTDAID